MRRKKKPTDTLFAAVLFVALFAAGGVSAHSSGASFLAAKYPYIIDVGYEPLTITQGDRMMLDFELWDSEKVETRKPVAYSRVWTRLEHEGVTVLATSVANPLFGPTSLLFRAHEPGPWVLHVRYERGEEILAEHSFPFEVAEIQESLFQQFVLPIVGVIIGASLVLLWYRFSKTLRALL